MKKGLVVALIIAVLVVIMSWFVYPRYKLYQFLSEYNDIDTFQKICSGIGYQFSWYYERFYEYPESSEDTVFRSSYYEIFGDLDIYAIYTVFVQKDTFLINDSIENVFKLYLKGPNHDAKHIGKIINPIDYKSQIITPVNMPFYQFLFSKGDILVGILPKYNPCDRSFPNFAYKEKLNDDLINLDSFSRAISFSYWEKYGESPVRIRDLYDDAASICYKANLYSDTLILTQVCEPFNGEYDTSPMVDVINKPLYTWAKEIGLHQFFFSIAVRPSFFEKMDK